MSFDKHGNLEITAEESFGLFDDHDQNLLNAIVAGASADSLRVVAGSTFHGHDVKVLVGVHPTSGDLYPLAILNTDEVMAELSAPEGFQSRDRVRDDEAS
jgi:hypothetical protein